MVLGGYTPGVQQRIIISRYIAAVKDIELLLLSHASPSVFSNYFQGSFECSSF